MYACIRRASVVLSVLSLTGIMSDPWIIMEGFERDKFSNGLVWKIDCYTRSVFGLTPRCAFMKVLEQYRHTTMYLQFTNRTDAGDLIVSREIGIKDDGSYPSRFFLENERSELFDAAMISSDYENFTMIWMKEDEVESYLILLTGDSQEPHSKVINHDLRKLKLSKSDFLRVDNRNCGNVSFTV